jgi:hemerythrin superfamily protein
MPIDKVTRKKNYHMLRAAGFTSKEADKFKDRTQRIVKLLCDIRKNGEDAVEKRIKELLEKHK